MSVKLTALHRCYQLSLRKSGKRFFSALSSPAFNQENVLKSIIEANSVSKYGRKYGFSAIQNIEEFRDRIPVTSYEDYLPYVTNLRHGKINQLTTERVSLFEPTSGSSGHKKLIPYTQGLLSAFNSATKPWLYNLAQSYPRAFRGKHYWSVSPAHEQKQYDSKIPIGMADDSDYFDPLSKWFISQIMAVPSSIRHIQDEKAWQFQTARALLESRELSLISVWSPTFLTVLLSYIKSNFTEISKKLSRDRRSELNALTSFADVDFDAVWPNLELISCWTDGVSHRFSEELKRFLPTTKIQGKGLLTTEGVVSIPWQLPSSAKICNATGHVLAITSHFLEFQKANSKSNETLLSHELEKNEEYIPILTTQGGLYRYKLSDIIRCTGYIKSTPTIEFVGKIDSISDIAGEKLNSALLDSAMQHATKVTSVKPTFSLAAPPNMIPGSYCLFIESQEDNSAIDMWINTVEKYLRQSHHYQHAQRLGQLAPLVWQRVSDGWLRYQKVMIERGMKLGDIKPTSLETRTNWYEIFKYA